MLFNLTTRHLVISLAGKREVRVYALGSGEVVVPEIFIKTDSNRKNPKTNTIVNRRKREKTDFGLSNKNTLNEPEKQKMKTG